MGEGIVSFAARRAGIRDCEGERRSIDQFGADFGRVGQEIRPMPGGLAASWILAYPPLRSTSQSADGLS